MKFSSFWFLGLLNFLIWKNAFALTTTTEYDLNRDLNEDGFYSSEVYLISSVEDYLEFTRGCYPNTHTCDAIGLITKSLDFSGLQLNTFDTLGYFEIDISKRVAFTGVLEGDGHTLRGLQLSGSPFFGGVVSYVTNSTGFGIIKNITIADSVLSGSQHAGGIVGVAESFSGFKATRLENLVFQNSQLSALGGRVGGVVSWMATAEGNDLQNIESSIIIKASSSDSNRAGGIAGEITNYSTDLRSPKKPQVPREPLYNWFSSAKLLCDNCSYGYYGGLIGYLTDSSILVAEFDGSIAHINPTQNIRGEVGGIVGISFAGRAEELKSQANISGVLGCLGGLIGKANGMYLNRSINNGNISGNGIVGGICGECQASKFSQIINNGDVHMSDSSGIGGIAGFFGSLPATNTTATDILNTGRVSAHKNSKYAVVGGLFGRFAGILNRGINIVPAISEGGGFQHLGGIAGIIQSQDTSISNSFSPASQLKKGSSGSGIGLTPDQFGDASLFTSHGYFESPTPIWEMSLLETPFAKNYPILIFSIDADMPVELFYKEK